MSWKGSAGQRSEKVEVQVKSTEQDEYGQLVESWETDSTVWASVKQEQGDEGLQSGQIISYGRVLFTGLYEELKNVNAKDYRIKWNGQVYDILSEPVRLGFNEYLQIKTEFRDNE